MSMAGRESLYKGARWEGWRAAFAGGNGPDTVPFDNAQGWPQSEK